MAGSQQQQGANNSREPTTEGRPATEGRQQQRDVRNIGNNSRRRDQQQLGWQQQQRRYLQKGLRDETAAVRKTATAGPTAAQDTTGTSGYTNNSRETRIGGTCGTDHSFSVCSQTIYFATQSASPGVGLRSRTSVFFLSR